MEVRSSKRLITPRRATTGGVSAVAGLLAVASMAWACTVPSGTTWYSDGTSSKTGAPGTVIQAYATGAIQGIQYRLVLGDDGNDPGHASHACMVTQQVLNAGIVQANSRGRLPITSGTVGSLAPKTYQLCFVDSVNNSTGTGGATFTVI